MKLALPLPRSLLLFLFLTLLSLTNCQHVLYKETKARTELNAQEAINNMLFGLIGYVYEPFYEGNILADISLLEIFPTTYEQKGKPKAKYLPPKNVNIEYVGNCFCINYTAIAIFNWIFIPFTSSIQFTTCFSCNISIDFKTEHSNSPAIVPKLSLKSSLKRVEIENTIGKIIGLESYLFNALSKSAKWAEYFESKSQDLWKRLSVLRYIQAYSNYRIEIVNDAGTVIVPIPYDIAEMNFDVISINYGTPKQIIQRNSKQIKKEELFAHEHEFYKDTLEEIYKKIMELKWGLNLKHDDFPKNMTVKLDTVTFAQVIPDMMIEKIQKNLTAKIEAIKSPGIKVKFDPFFYGASISNLKFKIAVADTKGEELLRGSFSIDMKLALILHCTNYSSRLFPRIVTFEVDVEELNSAKYETIIKGGMARIIYDFIEQYYMLFIRDKTLGTGIRIANYEEKINVEKSGLYYTANSVSAKIFERTD